MRPRRRSSSYRPRRRPAGPPKKKTLRTYVRRNANINRVQSRQIRSLWNRQYGPVQRSLQLSSNLITVTRARPICFDASDYTSERSFPGGTSLGCRILQVNSTDTGLVTAGHFSCSNYAQSPFWAVTNKNLCGEAGRFKPIYAKYTVEVSCVPYSTDTYIQLDLVTQKAGFFRQVTNSAISDSAMVMPEALVQLPGLTFENELNPTFFKRYGKSKRLYLNSIVDNYRQGDTETTTSQAHAAGTTGKTRYFTFTCRPRRVRRSFEDPAVPGAPTAEDGQEVAGTFGQYNVDPRTPFWAIISCSDPIAQNPESIQVRIKRHVVWRDVNGTASL